MIGKASKPPSERNGTYTMPKHGWTCFFCGETFTTPRKARDHFGAEPLADPACQIKAGEERGLVIKLRLVEAELARYRAEDGDTDRAMYAMRADHVVALRRAEEEGYARGLKDGSAKKRA